MAESIFKPRCIWPQSYAISTLLFYQLSKSIFAPCLMDLVIVKREEVTSQHKG